MNKDMAEVYRILADIYIRRAKTCKENIELYIELYENIAIDYLKKAIDCEVNMTRLIILSKPIENLSSDEVNKMLKEKGFYDSSRNKQGKGIYHQYEVIEREGDKLVIDHTTGLTWQQSGSPKSMVYSDALKWIEELNKNKFAGYDDWCLPTLEEAMSIVEPESQTDNGLCISQIFDRIQVQIYTSDSSQERGYFRWVVNFYDGYCHLSPVDCLNSIRLTRKTIF